MKFENQIDKVKSFIGADKYKNTRVHTNIIRSSSNVAARASITFTNLMDLITSSTPPPNPTLNTCWIDISVTPAVFKRWDGSSWVIVNDWGGDIDDIKDNIKITEESLKTQSAEIKTMKDKIELKAEKTELNSKITEVKDEALKYTDSKILEAKAGITIETDRITQSVSETNKKVESVEINTNNSFRAVNEKVTTNESSINTLKNQIQLKVEQKDLDRVTSSNNEYTNTKITEAKSEIKLTTDGITQEVSKKVNSNSIVSTINQSAEAIKLKAEKIELNGATAIGDKDSNHVKIENANYAIQANGTTKLRIGVSNYGAVENIPSLKMGVYGIDNNNHQFSITTFGGGKQNPQEGGRAYTDMSYYDKTNNDWSNVKLQDGGDIILSPTASLIIRTNLLDGKYAGGYEREVARFTSSSASEFDGHLQVGAVRNINNSSGLVLGDDRNSTWDYRVRVYADNGYGNFMPMLNKGTMDLGRPTFKWRTVYATGGIKYSPAPSNYNILNNRSVNELDSIIDSLDFVIPPMPYKFKNEEFVGFGLNTENLEKHSLSNLFIKNTVEDFEGEIREDKSIDMASLLHLALYEIQNLKKEIEQLKNEYKDIDLKRDGTYIG